MTLTSKNGYRFKWRHTKSPYWFLQLKCLVFAKLDIVKGETYETADSSRLVDSVMMDSSMKCYKVILSFLSYTIDATN